MLTKSRLFIAKTGIYLISVIIILTLFLVQAQVSSRPETGILKDMSRTGHGILIIHNNWNTDSEVLLANQQDKPLMAVYIRLKESFNVTGIDDGEYRLYFTTGSWDNQAGKFLKTSGYNRYKPYLTFETKETKEEIEYSINELSLHATNEFSSVSDDFEFTATSDSTQSDTEPTPTTPASIGSINKAKNKRDALSPQLWIYTNSGMSDYIQCSPGSRLQEIMYLPRSGNLKVYEIYPGGDSNVHDYHQHPAGTFYPRFYADTPGRHIQYFTLDDEESNSITVDVI